MDGKKTFFRMAYAASLLSMRIAFEALSLALLEGETLYLLHIKLSRLLTVTLSSYYSLSKRNRNDTCLVRLILFIIYYHTASYCTITKNLGRYIEIQLQQVCKMQDTSIHFTHVILNILLFWV